MSQPLNIASSCAKIHQTCLPWILNVLPHDAYCFAKTKHTAPKWRVMWICNCKQVERCQKVQNKHVWLKFSVTNHWPIVLIPNGTVLCQMQERTLTLTIIITPTLILTLNVTIGIDSPGFDYEAHWHKGAYSALNSTLYIYAEFQKFWRPYNKAFKLNCQMSSFKMNITKVQFVNILHIW